VYGKKINREKEEGKNVNMCTERRLTERRKKEEKQKER
jgi:hypothetical protein